MEVTFFDAHVHGFPDGLFDAIWEYFANNYWFIKYRLHSHECIAFLRAAGAMGASILNYAHKPNISRDLNDWSHEFGKSNAGIISFGTIHPGDDYLIDELDRVLSPEMLDLAGLKLQILVTDFDPDSRELDVVYEKLLEHGKILVIHVGTGPAANAHVGISHLVPILERYPGLKLQVPHLGCFEYMDFFHLARDHRNIYFDTAMILVAHNLFSDEFNFDELLDAFLDVQDRIMFGSDFPNIPYDYSLAIQSIIDLPVSDAIREKIFWRNVTKFYDLPSTFKTWNAENLE
ncbi:MAG: amidohydrolase family protein [Promethearchaeota archaeon]